MFVRGRWMQKPYFATRGTLQVCGRSVTARGGAGILKIGKTLGVGTSVVQRVVEQSRPFEANA